MQLHFFETHNLIHMTKKPIVGFSQLSFVFDTTISDILLSAYHLFLYNGTLP